MINKKVCPFWGKRDNSLYYRQIRESVPTVPKCALLGIGLLILHIITNYNKVCPFAPHFGGRKGVNGEK